VKLLFVPIIKETAYCFIYGIVCKNIGSQTNVVV